ncbi:MAG: VgrG-related protein [Anaerolineae bacterium]|nr:VgrG-related protein [Anaerolineae bacterium]
MPTKTLAQFLIKIDGQDVSSAFMADLDEVVVDTSLYMPTMFTIRLRDDALKWVDDASLDLGKAVEISAETGTERGGQSGLLFKGEITGLEPDFSGEGKTILVVRGYDKFHRLHRGKKTRTFLKTKDSDVAQTLAGEAGLSTDIDATSVTHDYLLQNNQTNMEFLMSRAERIGYQVYVTDGKLCFKKGTYSVKGPELTLGENLYSFRPRWAATHQTDKVVVQGWDAKAKQAITSTLSADSALNQGGMTKTGGDAAKSAFGTAQAVVTTRPIFTTGEAEALGGAVNYDIGRDFVQAEGICEGDPTLKAGAQITVANVGTRFKGKYFVTWAAHIYNAEEGYTTSFSISGRQPNTISHLLESGNGHERQGLVEGVVVGLVTNNNDPDDLGRVKVKYPWLPKDQGAEIESDWIRVVSPMAGAERGFYYLPEVDDEVLVAFEHGDVHRPYMIGMLWNSKDKPPLPIGEVVSSGKVNKRVIKSRTGHVIILDDTSGQEQIVIRDKTGQDEIIIDAKEKNLIINIGNNITIEAKGKISQTSTQDTTMESKAKLTIKSTSNMTIESQGNMSLKSTGNMTLEATGNLSMKGLTTKVEGSTMTEVKGSIIKIG